MVYDWRIPHLLAGRSNDIYLDAMTTAFLEHRTITRAIFEMSVYGSRPGIAFVEGFRAFKRDAVDTLYQRYMIRRDVIEICGSNLR